MAPAAVPDYDRLARLLVGIELAPSPAEAQGMLCGLLALNLPDPLERWHAQLSVAPMAAQESGSEMAEAQSCCDDHGHSHVGVHAHDHRHSHADQDADTGADADADERLAALEQLADWTQSAIDPTSLSFDLLLPSEDRPLHERASAVLDWLRGLLFGFALGGLSREQLFGQAREAFDDLFELTRMDLESVVESDADEQALTEIIEFLRVAAMLIREDRAKALIDERDRQAAETGLH